LKNQRWFYLKFTLCACWHKSSLDSSFMVPLLSQTLFENLTPSCSHCIQALSLSLHPHAHKSTNTKRKIE
jgi:hypothetical protein